MAGPGRSRAGRKPPGQSSTAHAATWSNHHGADNCHYHLHSQHPPSTSAEASSSSSLSFIEPIFPAVPSASNVGLFLTNLRLLDLDLLEDWPDITLQTFASTKDSAGQGQKRRIQCVEWALYRLFCLWDPEESQNVSPYPLINLAANHGCQLWINAPTS